jgi:two-component system KDP operon response regulator KdpE
MQGTRVLIIEDDLHIRRMMRDLLTRAGSQVSSASDGPGGLQKLFSERPDLVILDVNMRESDGWRTLREMRVMTETPVIILGASSEVGASAKALSMGAADFIGKPFKARALLARTKNVLARRNGTVGRPATSGYEDSYLSVDPDRDRVMVCGERVDLTKTELRILMYLVANASLLVTFEEILREVWGPGYEDSIDYVHVYVSRLRRKIEERPRRPRYIVSEHGLGYRFNVSA